MSVRITCDDQGEGVDFTVRNLERNHSLWLRIEHFALYVRRTDEGIVVDIYRDGDEMSNSLGSTYALDSEALKDD